MIGFDEAAGIDANLETFLASMDGVDAAMGAILREAVPLLGGAVDDASRKAARIELNELVRKRLDEIAAQSDDSP